jgi:ElaB/YqjD/DUF883 family membrane-anchored ribosome-binding protein
MAKKENFIGRIRDKTQDAYDAASDKVIYVKDKTAEKISENPWKSVAIAAAIGAIVGVATSELIRGMRMRRRGFFERVSYVF